MSDCATVRLATLRDADDVFRLLVMRHEEDAMFSFDAITVRSVVQHLLADQSGGIIGVIEGPDEIEATVGLLISKAAWFTKDKALCELWTFVHPNYRRTTHAKSLIGFAKHWSDMFKNNGMTLPLLSSVVSTIRTDAKVRLYRRQVPFVGAFYLYNSRGMDDASWPFKEPSRSKTKAVKHA